MGSTATDKKILGILPSEALPGAILVLTALLAMIVVNSPLGTHYAAILDTYISVGVGEFSVKMKLAYWIKNALMAIFFFFVGLELKRELLEGQLSNPAAAALPMLAAGGGMLAPALIFVACAGAAGFSQGWAIPAATDIAFALGVLSLLGNRVPPALKAFLLAVAVVDDLGAIVIIAFFYTETIALQHLLCAGIMSAVLIAIHHFKSNRVWPYLLCGVALWVFLQNSGISATIAGVVVAACVPMKDKQGNSPLHKAEHDFRPWVLYGVMPIFAFANAGVALTGASAYLLHPITLGASFGLALGKPIGITILAWVGAKLLKTQLPGTMAQVIGVACLAGIGFTMSLFVGALAFSDPALATPVRLGVYGGSIISGVLGLLILTIVLPKVRPISTQIEQDETRHFMVEDESLENAPKG